MSWCSRAAVLVLLLLTAGTFAWKRPTAAEAAPKLTVLENGLTDKERSVFYHLEEGSEIFPIDWLEGLRSADNSTQPGKPFLQDLGRFGFLDDVTAGGPVVDYGEGEKRLPVGLTLAAARGVREDLAGKLLGVNCTACHVGEMTVG